MPTKPDDTPPPSCARCGQTLRYLTAIPKRFDQPSGFTVFRCDDCGRIQWETMTPPPK